ncbi:LytR C-terminal domain-containing protein [Actinokineospora sp. NBRC 105648]|uniref:caspase, EACC1-associated type n=1 Tax=Actinokineospora sp. NBRC 105648 TaxID=3032206 RepID=UPI00255736DD|nr:LytR C-terminal domain-containing protein [Actinokineospora sp. NBRC 105648]
MIPVRIDSVGDDTVRLPDPERSAAVLIGTTAYCHPDLVDLPAVAANLRDLRSALIHPVHGSYRPDRVTVLEDPDSARTIYRVLRRQTAEDTLLVYFAGHGLVGATAGDLHLALAETDPDELRVSALPFDVVREALRDSPATTRALILDCCFSGRVTTATMGTGQTEIEGAYTLASAPANALSLAPPGATHTAFTGTLIDLLTTGIPHGPELLTLGTIYPRLRAAALARGYPVPTRQGTGTADQLAIARNPAWGIPIPSEPLPTSATAPRRYIGMIPTVVVRISVALLLIVGIGGVALAIKFNALDDLLNGDRTAHSTTPTSASQTPRTTTSTTDPPATATTTSTTRAPDDPKSQPVRIYNNSTIDGLETQAADDLAHSGWTISVTGNYTGGKIPTSTAYYQADNPAEKAAAKNIAAHFGLRVEERWEGIADSGPGVIVIVTNDYHSP